MVFETRPHDVPYMNIFVEPVTFDYLQERAIEKQRRVDEFERAVMFPDEGPTAESLQTAMDQPGADSNVQVQKKIEIDNVKIADDSDSLTKILAKQQAPAEPEPEPEPEPKRAIDRLLELLSDQVDNQASETDPAAQLAQAQTSAVNIIREASKFREADLVDVHRSTRKGELKELKMAASKLNKSMVDIESTLAPGAQGTDYDGQIARLKDVAKRTLDECGRFRLSQYESSRPILSLALMVRNKVNGHYVSGPPEVNCEDEWDIEYSIQEMEDNSKAWGRYEACIARRDNASPLGKDDPEADEKWYGGRFMQELEGWSRRGAEWRLEQDEIDRTMGKKEVFEPIDKSVIDDVESDQVAKEEKGQDVAGGYMTWLFSGKGGDAKKE